MSLAAIDRVRRSLLKPTPKAFLKALAFYADDEVGPVRVDLKSLAMDMNVGARRIQQEIAVCRRAGYLTVYRTEKPSIHLFVINLDALKIGSQKRYRKVPIPRELRFQVFERDGHRCKRCGTQDNLSADHIKPESKGGPTTLDNLQTLCRSCNSRKKDRL